MKPFVSLVVEDWVDHSLLHVGLFAMPPALIGQQVQADVRVCAIFAAWKQVPAGEHTSENDRLQLRDKTPLVSQVSPQG